MGIKLETLGGLKLETVIRNQVQNFKFDFPEYIAHISVLK